MEESLGMTKTQAKSLMKYISNNMKVPVLGAGGGFAPLGCINAYMGTVAPQGWLICNGQIVNISDYPELAAHFASQLGSSNVFGGDGTTTFAMPDLRGEFLRGSGTNSHSGQGNGANVGVHQDGTKHSFTEYDGNSICTPEGGALNTDYQSGRVYSRGYVLKTNADDYAIRFTSRPTNTSVLFIIKATVSGDANAHQYSTDEQIVGTWIDGSILYEKTIEFNNMPTATGVVLLNTGVSGINQMVDIKVKWYDSPDAQWYIAPRIDSTTVNCATRTIYKSSSNEIKIGNMGSNTIDWSNRVENCTCTILYTKTQS